MVIRWTGSGASAAWCGMRCIEVSCDAWHAEGGEVGRAEHEKVQGEKLGKGTREGGKVGCRGKSRRRGVGKGAQAQTYLCVHLCVRLDKDE